MTAEETFDEQSASDESAADRSASEASSDEPAGRGSDHLAEVEDGAGCTEIWEHLSDRRENDSDEE